MAPLSPEEPPQLTARGIVAAFARNRLLQAALTQLLRSEFRPLSDTLNSSINTMITSPKDYDYISKGMNRDQAAALSQI